MLANNADTSSMSFWKLNKWHGVVKLHFEIKTEIPYQVRSSYRLQYDDTTCTCWWYPCCYRRYPGFREMWTIWCRRLALEFNFDWLIDSLIVIMENWPATSEEIEILLRCTIVSVRFSTYCSWRLPVKRNVALNDWGRNAPGMIWWKFLKFIIQ